MQKIFVFGSFALSLVGCVSGGSSTPIDPGSDGSGGFSGTATGSAGRQNAAGGTVGSAGAVSTGGTGNAASAGAGNTNSGGTSTGGRTGASGSTSTGGGAAGGPPVIVIPSTGHGFKPTTLTTSASDTAYATFKTKYLVSCGAGTFRVNQTGTTTVSEGIGYGMLLAVGHNDRPTFDGLWNYYKARRNANGLMNWKIDGCTTTALGMNGASDGDLDCAMALVQADKKWTGYTADATSLITSIKSFEVATAGSLSLIKPGDGYTGAECINYSYFAPGYYRVFGAYVPSQASTWLKLADDVYPLINMAANGTTGLVPNWSNASFQPSCASGDGTYGYDAARTPWRIAVDYVWFGTPAAQTWATKVVNWVGNGILSLGDGYNLDGTPRSMNHNSAFVGAFSAAAMAHSQARADEFGAALGFIANENAYYQETLRAVYLLLLTDNFKPN